MKVAFFKGTRPGVAGIYSWGVRTWTRTPYSHVELIFSNGTAASSSAKDNGVRFVENFREHLDAPEDWDIIELPDHYAANAWAWFEKHEGERYDIFGNVHFVISIVGGARRKWFCSEAVAAALGIGKPERFNPGDLYEMVKFIAGIYEDPALTKLAA